VPVVEFLNTQTDPAEFLLSKSNDTLQTLVPHLIGQTAEAQIRKAIGTTQRQWDESSFFQELERRRGQREASVCREILRWGRQQNLKPWWGKGAKDGSFLLRFETSGSIYHLVSAWTYGRVEIQFKMLSRSTERLQEVFPGGARYQAGSAKPSSAFCACQLTGRSPRPVDKN
jgi:hypothetical protein